MRPTKFELVINMNDAAKALGIEVPISMQMLALQAHRLGDKAKPPVVV